MSTRCPQLGHDRCVVLLYQGAEPPGPPSTLIGAAEVADGTPSCIYLIAQRAAQPHVDTPQAFARWFLALPEALRDNWARESGYVRRDEGLDLLREVWQAHMREGSGLGRSIRVTLEIPTEVAARVDDLLARAGRTA